ncbi:hypothetical protein, partial [Polymorphobacter arshaanensis]|uniref:hypothetical protein n=1 Tax=Glacieibacterium arshaanense TaxID=2511025 RepID=UPI001A9C8B76
MKERLESAAVGDVENDLLTVKTAIDDNDGASIDQRSTPEGRSSSHADKVPLDSSTIIPDSNPPPGT